MESLLKERWDRIHEAGYIPSGEDYSYSYNVEEETNIAEPEELAESLLHILHKMKLEATKEDIIKRYISIDNRVLSGSPVIKGTRVPVYLILEYLSEEYSFSEIRKELPTIESDGQIKAAILFASEMSYSSLDQLATMKVLTDEDVEVKLSNKLMGKGFSVETISGIGKKGLSDDDVLRLANEKGRVLITRDYGFKYRNRHPAEAQYGIIIVKLKVKAVPEVLPKFCHTFTEHSDKSSMRKKIIEVGRAGYYAVFVDQEGKLQKRYAKYGNN